jgi:hypothetical protein
MNQYSIRGFCWLANTKEVHVGKVGMRTEAGIGTGDNERRDSYDDIDQLC